MTSYGAGFHVSGTGGNRGDLGGYITRLAAANLRPVINAVDDAALAVDAVNAGGVVVFRKTAWSGAPDYNLAPDIAALERWQIIEAMMPAEIVPIKDKLYIEPTNEPDKERADWLGRFMHALATVANADGYRISGLSWATGNPEPDAWETPGILDYLRYVAAHPGMNCLSLHEYSLSPDDITVDYPWLIGRYQFMFDACDAHGIARPAIIITEAGWAYNDMPDSGVMQQIEWLANEYGEIPFCLWTLGSGSQWGDLPKMLSAYVDDVTDWMLTNSEPSEPEPEPDPGLWYKSIVVLAPQDYTLEQMLELRRAEYANRRTITQSHDEALQLRQLGQPGSYTIVYDIERWEPEIRNLLTAGEHELRSLEPEAPADAVSLDVPYLSQWTPDANASSGDCGPATVAMIANWFGINVTVNQAALACGQPPGSHSTSISQLQRGLNSYGALNEFMRPWDVETLRQSLDRGEPVILLVHYGAIPGRQDVAFTGGHFFVAVGYGTDEQGDYFLTNDSNFWGTRIHEGDHRKVRAGDLDNAMAQATLDGNYARQGIAIKPMPIPIDYVDMAHYFLPRQGDYGDIVILKNNWGEGDERQQLQRDVDLSFVTKNQQWERRRITDGTIYLQVDTSPGDNEYYEVESPTGWMPRFWKEGQTFTRYETARFYNKGDCSYAGRTFGPTSSDIAFAVRHDRYTTRGGITFEDVAEIHWIRNAAIEERYFLAAHYGLIAWSNRHGRESWATEVIPVGQQGNNSREAGCFSS